MAGSGSAAKSSSAAAPTAKSASGTAGGSSTRPGPGRAGQPRQSAGSAGPTPGAPPRRSRRLRRRRATDLGVTANSIKVGHIGIYSGPVGSFGDDLSYAGRAKLQEINDSGGINGRKLDVLVRDDAWDGTKGMNAARDLVEREKIFAFCCIMSVNTSDPLTPYADEHKIPHVGADGWGEPQYKGEWTFPVSASAVTEAHMLAKYQAEKQAAKRVAILYINNPTGRAYVKAYDEVIKKFGGAGRVLAAGHLRRPGHDDVHRPGPDPEHRHHLDLPRPRHLHPDGPGGGGPELQAQERLLRRGGPVLPGDAELHRPQR